ncbi:alanine racemase [Elstera cyanobacteriorum]|uniref:alanine racemase n=1 Tax=Elstera cyanobacteriorum TaxID=2022747 RepID=UPI0023555B4B|nr:alanine racemase [Elstera cyanobacteriorum]MCK6442335.1 alanine racemase [Elstera cyanobacteriorum]
MPTPATLLTIDRSALAANWRFLAGQAAHGHCAAVVKADGYGLGAVEAASAFLAAGCTRFFVAHLAEAIILRAGLTERFPNAKPGIGVLNGLLPGEQAEFLAYDLLPVLNTPQQIADWQPEHPAILQIDTGMSRVGLEATEFDALLPDLRRRNFGLLISHFARADEPQEPLNRLQIDRFSAAMQQLPGVPGSLAASSGIFLGPDAHFDLLRPGYALYGGNPVPGKPNPMQRTVTLTTPIIQVRDVEAGRPVGYGSRWHAPAPARIATIPYGYADGIPRVTAGATFWLNGKPAPVVGRVSMDLITLDVTALPEAVPGAQIEILGPNRDIDTAGADGGTLGYEILTSIGRRAVRQYIG